MNNDTFEKLIQNRDKVANLNINPNIYVGEKFIAKGGILNAVELKSEAPENSADY